MEANRWLSKLTYYVVLDTYSQIVLTTSWLELIKIPLFKSAFMKINFDVGG